MTTRYVSIPLEKLTRKQKKYVVDVLEQCPICLGGLDTGWECNECGFDARPIAYPWWERWRDKLMTKLRRLA